MMEYTGKYKKMAEQFRADGCDEYTVEKFIREDKWGLVIEGTCATCGKPIARTQDVI